MNQYIDLPFFLGIDCRNVDTRGNVVSADRFEPFQRSANAVVHSGEQSGRERSRHRHSGGVDRLAGTDAGRVFVAL